MDTIKRIISRDGKHRLDIDVSIGGLYRYATFDDRYRNDPEFQSQPEWTIVAFSGLYDSAEAAEAGAVAELAWLREQPVPRQTVPPLSAVYYFMTFSP